MSSPKESATQRTTSLFGRPSYKSLTLPLQELATLFSQPLTSTTKQEPMEQAAPPPSSEQPSSVHVEICQAPMSTLRASQMRELVRGYLMRVGLRESVVTEFSDTALSEHVISITITDVPTDKVCTAL